MSNTNKCQAGIEAGFRWRENFVDCLAAGICTHQFAHTLPNLNSASKSLRLQKTWPVSANNNAIKKWNFQWWGSMRIASVSMPIACSNSRWYKSCSRATVNTSIHLCTFTGQALIAQAQNIIRWRFEKSTRDWKVFAQIKRALSFSYGHLNLSQSPVTRMSLSKNANIAYRQPIHGAQERCVHHFDHVHIMISTPPFSHPINTVFSKVSIKGHTRLVDAFNEATDDCNLLCYPLWSDIVR